MAEGKNTLRLDVAAFLPLVKRLERLDGDVKGTVNKALKMASKKVTEDTEAAIAAPNLPAGGDYSTGATMESIVRNPEIEWQGSVASVPVGFDFAKEGHGGYLIAGTPKMSRVEPLFQMYRRKKYMKEIDDMIQDELEQAIADAMEGKT